tara:strand:- start:515 stop:1216 length:702 start_codon:yes stop_codon:yes gene_type:complete
MKKLLLILLCLPFIGFGQQTYVPDDNFEAYLEASGMGNGIANDDYVTTANINTVNMLGLDNSTIFDLTGIEDFTLLHTLLVRYMYLTELDVSQNTFLSELWCNGNQLTCLNVSGCLSLYTLSCNNNFLTQLDLSTNISLSVLLADGNPLLNCIQTVSNPTFSTTNIDTGTLLSSNCNYGPILNCSGTTGIKEHTTNKKLLRTIDVLGRETKESNQPLFYIYDDGTVEKRIVIE